MSLDFRDFIRIEQSRLMHISGANHHRQCDHMRTSFPSCVEGNGGYDPPAPRGESHQSSVRICERGLTVSKTHGIQLDGSRFWVTHRRKTYGPFDYEWSSDFCGVVMLYDGQKFGEYCSIDELYADLKPFSLPMTVVCVTSIVMGCLLHGILNGLHEQERFERLASQLRERGFNRFVQDH